MRQKELLDNIKKFLARFEAQVRISSLNGEYDINIHSENVLIPILNIVYNLDLKNVNFSDGKNSKAIDLIDEEKRVAFQITSTNGIEKVKSTIAKLLKSKFAKKVDKLFIYILTNRQDSYLQDSLDKAGAKKIRFTAKQNIMDPSFLYRIIGELNDIMVIENIERILSAQFSDVYINSEFTLTDFEKVKERYKKSCLTNFSRINFFGLSVNANKPREIELYLLFVNPRFLFRYTIARNYKYSGEFGFYNMLSNNIEHLIREPLTEKVYDPPISLSRYFENLNFEDLVKELVVRNEKSEIKGISVFEDIYDYSQQNGILNFEDLFSKSKNVVVIGNPGAGKSSFIKYSICKILDRDESVFSNKEIYEHVPFRLELHKYNIFKRNNGIGIIQYLTMVLKSEFQLDISENVLVSIIKSFPTIFFFDGLDEVFDIQERLNVRNDIENFVKSYDLVRSVVTSRFESYEEVFFSQKLFGKLEILSFDDQQVNEYVGKWYDIEEANETLRNQEKGNCLSQLRSVSNELKHNPLLLSLILLLYRNELDIPTSKLSIYESCTNTIVETRDTKEKKIDFGLKILNKLSVFSSLAYWQFKNDSEGKSAPSYESVRMFIKSFLLEKRQFGEDLDAQNATDEFLNFAKIRSIYFENKFTHKTFLEYFSAYYIYSNYYNKGDREVFLELIKSYLGYSAWSVVLELLICKIDSNQIDFEVVDGIIESLFEENKIDTLSFLLQTVRYLQNVSPNKIRFIISESLKYCFTDGEAAKEYKGDYKELLFNHIASLVGIPRFQGVILESFQELFKKSECEQSLMVSFAYEFAIISGNASLVSYLDESEIIESNEYLFILKNYPKTLTEVTYLALLQEFVSEYSVSQATKLFKSPFGQKIFFGNDRFNWSISFIAAYISNYNLSSLYSKLLDSGLTKESILDSVKHDFPIIQFENAELQLANTSGPDGYKRFIRALQDRYKSANSKGLKSKQPFYDKFFRTNVKSAKFRR